MRSANFPVLVGEITDEAVEGRKKFPFLSWAAAQGFKYPSAATEFLSRCDSAAEAYFARAFIERDGVTYRDSAALKDGITLSLQERCGHYLLDAVARDHDTNLAVEIDGLQFHHRTRDQLEQDYLRQRRIVARGFAVIRFMAHECFVDPAECWRQTEAILRARARK
jgi:very-short-patch-repair endonuclease